MNTFERKLRGLPSKKEKPDLLLFRPTEAQLANSIAVLRQADDDDVNAMHFPTRSLLAVLTELQQLREVLAPKETNDAN